MNVVFFKIDIFVLKLNKLCVVFNILLFFYVLFRENYLGYKKNFDSFKIC